MNKTGEPENLKQRSLWGHDRTLDIEKEFRSCVGYANTPGWAVVRNHVRRAFGTFQGLRTVELGSGLGKVSILFSLLGADVTLVDYSAKQLADANRVHEYFRTSAHTVRENMLQLPKQLHGCFDIAMSFGTAEHFWGDERQAVFNSHASALRSGGMAVIWVPNEYGLLYRVGRAARLALGRIPVKIEETPFSRNELRRRAAAAGLVDPYIIGGTTFREDFTLFIYNFKNLFRHQEKLPFSKDAETNRKALHKMAHESRTGFTAWENHFSYSLVLVARRP